jgi:hypothetical protein
MAIRQASWTVTAALLTCGLVILGSSTAAAQRSPDLPRKGGQITLWGCFVELKVKGNGKFQLVNPTIGTATSVPEGTCTGAGTDLMVKLQHVHEKPDARELDEGLVGQWIEVSGRLEDIDTVGLREVHVTSFRIVPVVPPRAAQAAPFIPRPPAVALAEPTPAPAPVPEAQVAAAELPKTASALPMTGLCGVLALASGVACGRFRRRVAR